MDIAIGDDTLHLYNVHLGTAFLERRHQAGRLSAIVHDRRVGMPKVVLGDFNEWMRGLATQMLSERLQSIDLRAHLRRRRTYPGVFPVLHLDHIYYEGRGGGEAGAAADAAVADGVGPPAARRRAQDPLCVGMIPGIMSRSLSCLLAVLALSLSPLFAQRDADPGRLKVAPTTKDWVQLFNGKDLDGWTPKITGYPLGENYADTFRVENGVLKVSYDKYAAFDEQVRTPVLQPREVLVLHARRGIPLRRRPGRRRRRRGRCATMA